jgi:heptosyltransferase-2
MDLKKWQNVLVVQTSFLGDTVLTLPLLNEIKRRFPATRLSLLCTPRGRELLQDHVAVDEILVDDKKGLDKGWLGLWRQARLLRQKRFTMAISPHKSLRSALLLFFARIPQRVGFSQSKGWFLYNRRTKRSAKAHDVDRTLSILRVFGIQLQDCERRFGLPTKPEFQESVTEIFRSRGIHATRPVMGVNPGSVWPTKRWLPEGFARTIELLKQKYDCDVVLFGGPDDAAVAKNIDGLCGGAAVNLAGRLSLRELPVAIGRCSLFISNDSGPMHIAVAQGVPTVSIFCATTPSLGFYPYSSRAIVLEKALPCRPCSSHGGRRCPLGTEDCIRLITPEHVIQAVDKLLRGGEPRANPSNGFVPEFMVV